MSVNLSESSKFSVIGKMWELILCLLKVLSEVQLMNGIQQVINDPFRCHIVADALIGKMAAVEEMTQSEWIERETNTLSQLGLIGHEVAIQQMATQASSQYGYFIPAELTRSQLLELASKMGIKLHSSPNCVGDEISTQVGVLECNLSEIMTPTDPDHSPFNLNCKEQEAWAERQGGKGLTSVEETIYLLIRAFLQFGQIPFMGGWIRCRNHRGSERSLFVSFNIVRGLDVYWDALDYCHWRCGAIPWKFS